MRASLICLVTATVLVFLVGAASAQFWYAPSGRIPLHVDSATCRIRFDSSVSPIRQAQLLQSVSEYDFIDSARDGTDFTTVGLRSVHGYEELLQRFRAIEGVI